MDFISFRCYVSVCATADAAKNIRGEGNLLGGAILLGGKLLRGAQGLAGEFSYVMTSTQECMERHHLLAEQCGVPALIELASAHLGMPESTLTGEIIFQCAQAGDTSALTALREYAAQLAVQILTCM